MVGGTMDQQPTAVPSAPEPERVTIANLSNTPSLTEEHVRDLLQNYVNDTCCYGKDPITQMNIRDISKLPVFRFKLETFIEKRTGSWKTVGYSGPMANIVGSGVIPDVWNFIALPDIRFKKSKKVYEFPNTISICNCPRCQGSGRVQCGSCGGSGSTPCSSCTGMGYTIDTSVPSLPSENGAQPSPPGGDGAMPLSPRDHIDNSIMAPPRGHHGHHHGHHNNRRSCHWCSGSGRRTCTNCNRMGVRTCSTCDGNFRIKTFYQLTVFWNTKDEVCMTIDGDLTSPYRKYFSRLLGTRQVASQCSNWAQALENFPDVGVRTASRAMLEAAVRKYHGATVERIVEFRQSVVEIQGTVVRYEWKGKQDIFIISGQANAVHFPNSYPQECGSCTIL